MRAQESLKGREAKLSERERERESLEKRTRANNSVANQHSCENFSFPQIPLFDFDNFGFEFINQELSSSSGHQIREKREKKEVPLTVVSQSNGPSRP